MSRPSSLLLITTFLTVMVVHSANADPYASDETTLRTAGLLVDAGDLLAFLRLRTEGGVTSEEIAEQISRLGLPSAAARTKAAAKLIGIGTDAIPALRQLARDPDAAGAVMARRCLQILEDAPSTLTSAAVRLIAVRRPPGATATLLAFLPHAEDDYVIEEVQAALTEIALHTSEPEPVLLEALKDSVALRRAVAIDVICQTTSETRSIVQKLLFDPVPAVRLRAALVLAREYDQEAVSVIINLLTELPPSLASQAEEYLLTLADEQTPKILPSDEGDARIRCRAARAAWWKSTEDSGPALGELRKRTQTDADREKALTLINALGDDRFEVRQKATEGLKAMGVQIASLLRQASQHPDLEVRQRAQDILKKIEKEVIVPLSPVVPRLLALRKPVGADEALLAYLPFADDDSIAAEVQAALNVLAFRDGKPSPVLIQALNDRVSARRAAAAEALGLGPSLEYRDAVRKLLADRDPFVRLKAAFALASVRDRSAIPVLIALTAESSSRIAANAEDYLSRLTDNHLPPAKAESSGSSTTARAKRCDVLTAWWQAESENVKLVVRPTSTQLTRCYQGYTLLVQPQNGEVAELDSAGKTRWRLSNLANPQDARMLSSERVLVTEAGARRVTERNLKGKILWEKSTGGIWPLGASRLSNGHTLIVARNQISEVDHTGREVFVIDRPDNDVMTASKTRDGKIAIVSSQSRFVLLDITGRELKSFHLQGVSNFGNEILPKGGVLVPLSWQNKVMEYDAEGKVVWEVSIRQPVSAFRLPNGNTLVGSPQSPMKIIEVDHAGKQVAETAVPTFVQQATRR